MEGIEDKTLFSAVSEYLVMSRFLSKNLGIGKFVVSSISEESISKYLQNSYLYKVRKTRLEEVTLENKITVENLVSSHYKSQNDIGFEVIVTLRIGSILCK